MRRTQAAVSDNACEPDPLHAPVSRETPKFRIKAGSSIVRTGAVPESAFSSSLNRIFTINLMTSRGVKCSPAVSFCISENRRSSSSKM